METLSRFIFEMWHVVLELSPWLLFGLLLAGVLHVLLPVGFVERHLGRRRFGSVFKAVAVGVPMPLCSCGVIPTAIGLKKDGASDGAAMGFLISTPQTGVDSILVSASFLGWPFALFKVASALVSGLVGGVLVNAFDGKEAKGDSGVGPGGCPSCGQGAAASAKRQRRWREVWHFGLVELLRDIYRWLIVGVIVAALISTFIPAGKLQGYSWAQGFVGMLVMLAISLPMYVCALASVPMAASLVVAGVSPGAALVLLMAGPTTNVATMGAIYRSFGRKVLGIYLGTVAVMSVGLGLTFDWVIGDVPSGTGHVHPLPGWLEVAAAVTLIGLLAYFVGTDVYKRSMKTAPGKVASGLASSACCEHEIAAKSSESTHASPTCGCHTQSNPDCCERGDSA